MEARKKAFTLAEVLITLTIIGVIASMTIPALLQSTNEAELKTKWKKNYATLSQTYLTIINENGGTVKNMFLNDIAGSENLKNAFLAKLNCVKDCSGANMFGGSGTGATAEGCWTGSRYYLSGQSIGGNVNAPALILADGALMFFYLETSDCSTNRGEFYSCGYMRIDINGFQKPNTYGKDIFGIALTPNSLLPYGARGWLDPATTCIKGSSDPGNFGYGCSAKFLYE